MVKARGPVQMNVQVEERATVRRVGYVLPPQLCLFGMPRLEPGLEWRVAAAVGGGLSSVRWCLSGMGREDLFVLVPAQVLFCQSSAVLVLERLVAAVAVRRLFVEVARTEGAPVDPRRLVVVGRRFAAFGHGSVAAEHRLVVVARKPAAAVVGRMLVEAVHMLAEVVRMLAEVAHTPAEVEHRLAGVVVGHMPAAEVRHTPVAVSAMVDPAAALAEHRFSEFPGSFLTGTVLSRSAVGEEAGVRDLQASRAV